MSNAYLPNAEPRYMLTTTGERAEDAGTHAEQLADRLYAVSRWDDDKIAAWIDIYELHMATIALALTKLEEGEG